MITIIKGFVFAAGILSFACCAFFGAILMRDEIRLRLSRRRGGQRRRRGHTPVPGLPRDGHELDGYERAKLALVVKGYEASEGSDEKESQR